MNKAKSTKRALLVSGLALLLCVSLLVGSTFAWFTDSVTSAGNKIQSGTLKVDLELLDKASGVWASLKEDGDPVFTYEKWEPGYVDTKVFKVENEGNLALQWKAKFIAAGELSILADVIDVYVCEGAEAYPAGRDLAGYTRKGTLREFLSTLEEASHGTLYPMGAADSIAYFGIALKMQESAGNDYQDKTIGAFDIKILATQVTYEEDSFDDQYDKDATYPTSVMEVATAEDFLNACALLEEGDTIKLANDITLSEEVELPAGIILNGNGKQINGTVYAGGDLTIEGHTKVTAFSASYYDRTITIGQGACFEVTGGGRVSFAYGNVFNITGDIEDAKNTDKATVQPSLIIPAGISITGGSDAVMNITNAYVQLGSTTSKNNSANGTFTLNFTNSIVEFTKDFALAEPTSGKTPNFNVSIKDSVVTTGTKFFVGAPNSKVVIDNSIVTLGTNLRNSGTIELKNKSVLTGKTIQFGENGGNNGTIKVDDSSFTIVAGSTGHAFDGKGVGSINLTNGATASVDYYKAMTITADATSTFTGTEVA